MILVHSRCRSLAAVAVAALTACADPHYRQVADAEPGLASDAALDADAEDDDAPRDASLERDATLDAGVENEAALDTGSQGQNPATLDDAASDGSLVTPEPDPDTWAGPLLGTYVARSDSFTKDTLIGVINHIREISLVKIERTGAEVWLSAQTCAWNGDNSVGKTRLAHPSAVPPRHERVRYAQGRWRTEPGLQALGYSADAPPACASKAGLRVPKQPGQSWLTDTCSCPAPNSPLPVLEDCRVTDPDGDGAPGITYVVETLLNTSVNVHTVREFRFHFQDGFISDVGRHSAHETQEQQSFQLSCAPTQCANIATLSVPCPPSTNLVQLAPLPSDGGPATCDQALLLAATELAYPAPDFPMTCPK